jgi:hypothetical protein
MGAAGSPADALLLLLLDVARKGVRLMAGQPGAGASTPAAAAAPPSLLLLLLLLLRHCGALAHPWSGMYTVLALSTCCSAAVTAAATASLLLLATARCTRQ